MFIGFKMEHLYVMVVSEGVYEEVYKGSLIRPYLPHDMRIDMYNKWVGYNDLERVDCPQRRR
jgi:hypothetical protein